MTVDAATMGKRIAEARLRRGLTQEQLAEAISLDRSSLAKVETGYRRISALELVRVAEALDARIEWFVGDPVPSVVSHRHGVGANATDAAIDDLVELVTRNVEFVLNHDERLRLDQPLSLDRPATNAEAEFAAQTVREAIHLEEHEPVHDLAKRVPAVGLLAFCLPLPAGTADAATILLPTGAVAIVNGNLQVGRRRLSLAHELGHGLFADEYTVDWRVDDRNDPDSWESRIDRFARALLLPAAGLSKLWHELATSGDSVRIAAVRAASRFRVDMSTLARRLMELELISGEDGNRIRTIRTSRTDIIDLDLVPSDEFAAPYLPREYEQATLRLYRQETISAERAIDLMFGTLDEESLPELPALSEDAIWQFVS